MVEFDDSFPSSEGNSMTSDLQNYHTQILHQECFCGHNDSCQASLQSVDVNFDFWYPGLWPPPPPQPCDRLKRPCLIRLNLSWKKKRILYAEVTFTIMILRIFFYFASIDDYAKTGGLEEVWLLCSFHHESLRTWTKTIVSKFAISNHTALILGVHALRSYLKLICGYELHSLPSKKLVAQRIMVKLHQDQTTPGPPSFA